MTKKWVIGIDEAGRGPLAGPVAVGIVRTAHDFDWRLIPGVNDSKKLSAKKREEIFLRVQELEIIGKVWYSVQLPSAKKIDKSGITAVIKAAMVKGLTDVLSTKSEGDAVFAELLPEEVMIKLDGSLYAPATFIHQETIIKGDAKEKIIGLASIVAKVTRDRYMEKIAPKTPYQVYDFARHKGYGTLMHRMAIAKHGLSPEHRLSYCKNIKIVV